MEYSQRILVYRLSALGDVAILQPVVIQRAKECPNVLFLVAGPGLLAPLFEGVDNIQYIPIKKQSSIKLYKQLSAYKPTMMADMHFVLRSIGLDWLFRLHGIPVKSIRKKGGENKPVWKRYDQVLDRCKLPKSNVLENTASKYWDVRPAKGEAIIGIAPYSQQIGKIWQKDYMQELIRLLSSFDHYKIVLFGDKKESEELNSWAEKYNNVKSIAGTLPFNEELKVISSLNVMVSMDSANMHFASCVGTPVISLWGATHPKNGFYGWRQDPAWAIQSNLPCRPCSKFGKKPCRYNSYPCFSAITPQDVLSEIQKILGEK